MKQRSSDPFAKIANLNTPFHQEAERIHANGLRPEMIAAVPGCASGLSLAAWRALVVATNDALRARALVARFAGDHFRAVSPDAMAMVLHLDKLAARCRGRSIDAIPSEVEAHVEGVLALRPVLASKDPPPFRDIAPRLLAQVYRTDMVPPDAGHALARPLCEGLVTMLALDLGPAVTTVPMAWCEAWGQTDEALFRLGVENLRRRDLRRERLPCRVPGFLLSAEDICLSGQVHHLATHLGVVPRAGALVALPTRSLLLCVPLSAGDRDGQREIVRETVSILRDLQAGLARLMPETQTFSRDLYWWRDGVMKRFPVRILEKHAVLQPPDGFDEVVEGVAPRSVN